MDKIPIRQIAEEFGVNKDYALRLVRNRGEQLGTTSYIGKRNAIYLTRADVDLLISDYKPRQLQSTGSNDEAAAEGYGYFYIIQLHPEDLPNRLKVGYTNNIDVRLSDHRTIAPTLQLIKSWLCKRTWEAAAIASITRDGCDKVGVEVYDGEPQVLVERAEAFFSVMPQPSNNGGSSC
jgi:hypothetical protein